MDTIFKKDYDDWLNNNCHYNATLMNRSNGTIHVGKINMKPSEKP